MIIIIRLAYFVVCGFCCFGSVGCESTMNVDEIEHLWKDCIRHGFKLSCTGLPVDIPRGVKTVHLKNIYIPNRVLNYGTFSHKNWEHVTKLVITAESSWLSKNDTVGVFDSRCFDGLIKLEILQISMSSSFEFRPETLIGIPNLKLLDLSGCRRFEIDFLISALNNTKAVPNLKSLNLSLLNTYHSGIRLMDSFFKLLSLKRIQELDLSSIQVLYMNLTSLVENCETLEFINISRMMLNDYEFDHRLGFCPNLKRLDASYIILPSTVIPDRGPQTKVVTNKSVPLFFNLLPYFRKVEYFNLAGFMTKQIKYILNNVTFLVVGIDKFDLKTVVLRDNNFERLDLRVIAKKSKIESIDLSECNIQFINPRTFSSFSLMKIIDLSKNRLNDMVTENASLFEELFENLKHLTEVNLSNNRLVKIPYNLFSSNRKLKTILLSDNYLTQLSFNVESLKNLQIVNLEGNQIEVLDSASITRLNILKESRHVKYQNASEQITLFKLMNNPFSCACCDSLASVNWIFQSKSSIVNASLINCKDEHEQEVDIDQSALDSVQKMCNRVKIIITTCVTIVSVIVVAIVSFVAVRLHRRRKARELEMADRVALIKEGAESYQFVVFLSYSSHDEEFVQKYVYQSLNENLQRMIGDDRDLVCEGDRNFQLGRPIHDQISVLLKKSSVVLVVLSDNYCKSIHCRNEFDQAFMLEKPIVLMVKDQVEISLMTPLIRDLYEKKTRVLWLWEDGQYKLKTTWENVCTSIIELVDCK